MPLSGTLQSGNLPKSPFEFSLTFHLFLVLVSRTTSSTLIQRHSDLGMEEDDDSFMEDSESLVTEDDSSDVEDGELHGQFRRSFESGGDDMARNEDSSNLASDSDVTLPQGASAAKDFVPHLIVGEITGENENQGDEQTKTGLRHFALEEDVISVISLGEYSKPTVNIDVLPDDLYLTCQVLTKLPNGEYQLQYRPPPPQASNPSTLAPNPSVPSYYAPSYPTPSSFYGFPPQ